MVEVSDIIHILAQAGSKGMKLGKLATHVYNNRRSFFETPNYDDVYAEVKQTMLRLSKSSSSIIEPMDVRGYYRLNPDKLQQYGQLTIDFDGTEILLQEETEEEQPSVENQDMSLDLFADLD